MERKGMSARDAESVIWRSNPGGEESALSDLQSHSIQVEPVFTMGVSFRVGDYGPVAPCGPCVTTEMCPHVSNMRHCRPVRAVLRKLLDRNAATAIRESNGPTRTKPRVFDSIHCAARWVPQDGDRHSPGKRPQ
jgi:hypothetical protein